MPVPLLLPVLVPLLLPVPLPVPLADMHPISDILYVRADSRSKQKIKRLSKPSRYPSKQRQTLSMFPPNGGCILHIFTLTLYT